MSVYLFQIPWINHQTTTFSHSAFCLLRVLSRRAQYTVHKICEQLLVPEHSRSSSHIAMGAVEVTLCMENNTAMIKDMPDKNPQALLKHWYVCIQERKANYEIT